MNDQVDMITGNAIPVDRNPIPFDPDTQPLPVNVPITRELQQKSPVMTAMSQVEGVPLLQIS
jgi:hypothetical protein